jgi:purine-cytosine permease-like protein
MLARQFAVGQRNQICNLTMNTQQAEQVSQRPPSVSPLPGYITSAVPNAKANRAPWYKNTAPTYAGIFLWFVFWQESLKSGNLGGTLSHGILIPLAALVVAAAICHYLFYLAPGMLGMKTGLPLYIVGTSTFGAQGGFLMPGFLMGLLQFGWVGVNVCFSSLALAEVIPVPAKAIMVVWGALACFVGLKGIQYVAKVATYLPLIPLVTLIVLVGATIGNVSHFDANNLTTLHQTFLAANNLKPAAPALDTFTLFAVVVANVVGFFATAGAAGVDFGMNNRDKKDVSMGGLVGVALAIILIAGAAALVIAGVYGSPDLQAKALEAGKTAKNGPSFFLDAFNLIPVVLGPAAGKWVMFLLAVAAFPPACFSSFIAANSFKTTLPKVNPFISVGIGTVVAILLAWSGYAGDAAGKVFPIIGASFGPICGAMMVDYLLNGKKWSGPRAGFNPAGWVSWALGFVVGILPNLHAWKPEVFPSVPAPAVLAFVVGAVVYFLCAKMGMLSPVVPVSGPLAEATK